MKGDATIPQRRTGLRGAVDCQGEALGRRLIETTVRGVGSETTGVQRSRASATTSRVSVRSAATEAPSVLCGPCAQRHDRGRSIDTYIVDLDRERFRDPRAGVVQGEEERTVALPLPSGEVGRIQHGLDLFPREESKHRFLVAFRRNGEDSLHG